MTQPVIILGAGGHAKVLIDTLLRMGVQLSGITDPDHAKHGSSVLGVRVLGGDEVLLSNGPEMVRLANGVGSIGESAGRRRLFERFKARGYGFMNVVHPSAVIGAEVLLSEGVQVMAGVVIQSGTTIGRNTIINTRASVDHDCSIGDHVHIAPGVTLSGGVSVEEGSHIGTGATVVQGIRIGRNSIVGAGSVVLTDVPEGVTVWGVPGKVVQQ
ncbi:MAG TPA: acetyltransferase [Nitrospirota bacterium]|nr:acetyltransferase [Nitrospirota bacterium]